MYMLPMQIPIWGQLGNMQKADKSNLINLLFEFSICF